MSDNLGTWAGEFGKEYTDRNQYDPALRVEGFKQMIPFDARYILEVGSNYGNNLAAIEMLGKTAIGVEPNEYALNKGQALLRKIIPGNAYKLPFADNSFDLVFTCGVLIHIPPDKLREAMGEIQRVTKKYILTIEYMGKDEAILDDKGMKLYRGQTEMMWKRESYRWKNAKLTTSGELGKEWDNASWLLHDKL